MSRCTQAITLTGLLGTLLLTLNLAYGQTLCGQSTPPADAGPDQYLCNAVQALLSANTPPVGGVGAWSQSGGPAGAVFADAANAGTVVSGLTTGVYVFTWTVTQEGCPPASDEVTITVGATSFTADAGPDQHLCDVTQARLAGNAPPAGSGVWTQVSGPAGAAFTDAGNPATAVTGLLPGVYIFRWTITCGSCGQSSDDVAVTVGAAAFTANAGEDQTLCSVTQTVLGGYPPPAGGKGQWTQLSGPSTAVFADPGSATTRVSGLTSGVYTLRWTLSTGSCAESSDDVQITVGATPSATADAGPDQQLCNVSSAALSANDPAPGAGLWSQVSGPATVSFTDAHNPATGITGLTPGVYIFQWTINTGTCTPSSDEVQITVGAMQPAVTAGPDQRLCNATQAALNAGIPPAGGRGAWSQVNGPASVVFASPADPHTIVRNLSPGRFTFRWTVSNGACAPVSDEMQIIVGLTNITADAGPDQQLCDAATAALSANAPPDGSSGAWSQVAGPVAASFSSTGSPTTVVNGLSPGVYIFRWTITSGDCPPVYDDVAITVGSSSIVAAAGEDQRLCHATEAHLSANAPPAGGSGGWSQVSGPNTAAFADPAAPATVITGLSPGVYIFRWTVTSGACTPVHDEVAVSVGDTTVAVTAGEDQTLCNTATVTLAGSAPFAGNGLWTQVSGPSAAAFDQAHQPGATVSNLSPGVYIFRWTVTSGACAPRYDDVALTIGAHDMPVTAGPDQQLCGATQAIMAAGGLPPGSTGAWTQVSGPGTAVFADVHDSATIVSNLSPGVYVFRWTVASGACDPVYDEVAVTIGSTAFVADAGDHQRLCDVTQTTLTGNAPPAGGSGRWSLVDGPPAGEPLITQPDSAATTVTGLQPGRYLFRWAVRSGACGQSSDVMAVVVGSSADTANAGPDQRLCDVGQTMLAGNTPPPGATGRWTQASGPSTAVFADSSLATTAVTGLEPGAYIFRWTLRSGSCPPSSDLVRISVGTTAAATADAGPDQRLCDVTQTTLAGNTPKAGTGTWAQVSGPATAVFTDVHSGASTVTGLMPGVYTFRWTVRTGSCTPNSDDVQIIVGNSQDTLSAGPNQRLCDATQALLTARLPEGGIGRWSQVGGPAGAAIADSSQPVTPVTGLEPGIYRFRWTVRSGSCAPVSDVVRLVAGASNIAAVAGEDQNLCNATQCVLQAVAPAVGAGVWEQTGGPDTALIGQPDSDTTTVTGLRPGRYTFRWTITSGSCPPVSDELQVNAGATTVTADAGQDQRLCDTNRIKLSAARPAAGAGRWSQVSGPPAGGAVILQPDSASTTVTGITAGIYVFRWTVTSGSCAPASDEVTVTVGATGITAGAGPDQQLCNASQATLAAIPPPPGGSGHWTQVSGPAAVLANAASDTTAVTGLRPGIYIFRWTITSGACAAVSDDVKVTVGNPADSAHAGPDQRLCDTAWIRLSANRPSAGGSGIWTKVSGPAGAVFTQPDSARTTVTGLTTGIYVFRWTLRSGACAETSDEVRITVGSARPVANAGPDQVLCDAAQTTLYANIPAEGSGVWGQVSGPTGARFTEPHNARTTVTGLDTGVYVFRWTVSSDVCAADSSDEMKVIIGAAGITANAGPDQQLCGITRTTMAAERPSVGEGSWSQISGPAGAIFSDPASPVTTLAGLSPGVYTFRWTLRSGACAEVNDDVQITVVSANIFANAGEDQSLCTATQTTLNGNRPVVGAGTWSQVSGPSAGSFTNPRTPTTTVAGLVTGVYVFRWTIQGSTCGESSDDVQVTVSAPPTQAQAGADQVLNNSSSTVLQGNRPVTGSGTWLQVNGPSTAMIASPNDSATAVSGLLPGVYTFQWVISNGACMSSADNVQITVIPPGRRVDLQLEMSVTTPGPYRTGQRIGYEIAVRNLGPVEATGVQVRNPLPAGLGAPANISAAKGAAAYDAAANTLNWAVGNLDVQERSNLTFEVLITNAGNLQNSATASADMEDADSSNNAAAIVVTAGGELFIPNIITPNGDGKNDKFMIPGIERYPGSRLQVHNRWGNLVYQSANYLNNWDGQGLNEGTYYYLLELHTPEGIRVYKGWVELLR